MSEENTGSKYGELIGCEEMHFAEVNSDTAETYEAAAPEYLAPTAEITHEAAVAVNTRDYDNKPMFSTASEAATEVTIAVSGIPVELAAKLTGKPYKNGQLIDTGDVSRAPYFALSGRMNLGDGGYRYFQYLKGMFSIGAETAHTKEDDITVNTTELTYTAINTICSKFDVDAEAYPNGTSIKGVKGDTTDTNFTGAAGWFTEVQKPAYVVAGV